MHIEVPVKVNAYVDEGIAPLVEALNGFLGVVTLDSCEGSGDSHAYVHFAIRGDSTGTFSLVQHLSAALGRQLPSSSEYSVYIEWGDEAERPIGSIIVKRGCVEMLTRALKEIACAGGAATD